MKVKYYFKIVVLLALLAACTRPALAINIPDDLTVGDWDDINRVYTLTSSVTEGLVLTEGSLTLVRNPGVTITGSGTGVGISLVGMRNVIVQGMVVQGFLVGIGLQNYHLVEEWQWVGGHTIENNEISSVETGINIDASNGNTVTNNTISANSHGITLTGSSDNMVTVNTINTINSTGTEGISLDEGWQGGAWRFSKNNTISGNTVTGASIAYESYVVGILLDSEDENTLTNNTLQNNEYGIRIPGNASNSIGTQITENTILNNYIGIWGNPSYYYNLIDNTLTDNAGGIYLYGSYYCTLTGNTVTGHASSANGIYLNGSNQNTLTGNASSNNNYGIRFVNSNENTLTNNTISDNRLYGIWLDPSNYNQINNNNFISNAIQAKVISSVGNNFDGNYWSDWEDPPYPPFPPYTFDGGQDSTPYTEPDGWVVDSTPPEITCPGNTTIEAMEPDGVPIDDERIQTFLEGASATDNVDPPESIVITNNAPALFPPGDTIVTFTATDTSGNSSSCQSTVTVVEAAESCLRIIPRIINREGRLNNILAVIRFPAGTAEEDIDIGQNLILYPGDSTVGVEATYQWIVTWYRFGTLHVSVFACFSKDDLVALIPEDGYIEMMAIGRFTDGQYFYGFDNVNIISWTWGWW